MASVAWRMLLLGNAFEVSVFDLSVFVFGAIAAKIEVGPGANVVQTHAGTRRRYRRRSQINMCIHYAIRLARRPLDSRFNTTTLAALHKATTT